MPSLNEALPAIIRAVGGRPAAPASGDSRFEAVVAFAASGSLASGRGDRLATALDEAGLLEPEALATASLEEVVDALRDARIEANPKAVRLLQRVAAWYQAHREDLEAAPASGAGPASARRDELAAIRGVGRTTADAIALHVFGAATYPVDRATYRIIVRHGWIDPTVDYEEASQLLIDAAEADSAVLSGLSRGLADVGRRFCKPSGPRCEPCPLRIVLPDGGPIEADG
ncbi:endonuclease III domain-containing protein [Planctomyces sp. SH-PL62]|uniref:endonuclease III domain-containing protein n=1 Tax=Planctomyces sp. SH-PL62 TaxID=1636152 RepID=UPI00078EE200|nr:endonuclease III domain-containing protein [Planctomyces sp. SH-PL62]AMV38666.1 Endonuclease III [Planctomyces sp. SH-PL62]